MRQGGMWRRRTGARWAALAGTAGCAGNDPADRDVRADRERGSLALELAVITPALIALLWVMISAGRVTDASSRVEGAARDAARAASINHNGRPWADADQALQNSLATSGTSCVGGPTIVSETATDAAGVTHLLPRPGDRVEIKVSCSVSLLFDSFGVTISRTGVSVLDTFRGTT